MVNEIKVHDHGYVRYVDHMGSDTRIVEAARISYGGGSKGDDKDKKLLSYLYRNKHTSPFEMCKITFNIRMPIFCMRQFVRHRCQNLNEYSARYKEVPANFYIPSEYRAQSTDNKQCSTTEKDVLKRKMMQHTMRLAANEAYEAYETLLYQGVARELARIVLPLSTYTEIYSCFDLNNLLKFFTLRLHPHAQQEIRDYAAAMKTITAQHFPWTMELFDAEVQPSNS